MNKIRDTSTRKRILLVDDEVQIRQTISLVFAQYGYTVVEANNGAEALNQFRKSRFDLVVTDYEMPFFKGNELATSIRRLSPEQPILMVTGHGHAVSFDNPVNAVIPKPINFRRLQYVMDELMRQNEDRTEEDTLAEFAQAN